MNAEKKKTMDKKTLDAGRSYRCGAGTMHCSSDYFECEQNARKSFEHKQQDSQSTRL